MKNHCDERVYLTRNTWNTNNNNIYTMREKKAREAKICFQGNARKMILSPGHAAGEMREMSNSELLNIK
jgi:hypothetical protein